MPEDRQIQNPEDRPVTTARIGSRWTRFWWVWLVMVIAIFWVFGWGWFGSGTGGWWGATPTSRAAILSYAGEPRGILDLQFAFPAVCCFVLAHFTAAWCCRSSSECLADHSAADTRKAVCTLCA